MIKNIFIQYTGRTMMQIFFNLKGEFQWASIAAIVALIGSLTSIIFSTLGYFNSKRSLIIQKNMDQKKIDADIISKSRMHWIDNSKSITSQFITDALMLGAQYKMFIEKIKQYNILKKHIEIEVKEKKKVEARRDLKKFDKEMIERVDKINNSLNDVSKNHLLIKLNFSNNFEHEQILNLVTTMYERLRKVSLNGWVQYYDDKDLEKQLNNIIKVFHDNSLDAESLTNSLRDYYKKEWIKVKKGE